ncbi:DUF2264 domain-containing protein [Streptomyces sp. NA04227]|uniref:DUF2264 domain-containing protein n=1 Tax=Streptomyces sp. NA04227 TaxID=2742136 RepID=UPI0015902F4E|nr:DUF2264 domain-containing protein [Streptomyces sp. NA04227]QKW09771.1 DUF2264 domain-containing protein [Streptomyces sp. NA04227]
MQLPPEDRALSPYTGWTRSHWESAADALLTAVQPYAGPGHALINLPNARPSWSGNRSDGLEGYARTFLLAALRVAGAGGADPGNLLERYAAGLDAGTRAPSEERDLADGDLSSWCRITDRGQAMVESASIAAALRLTRPWLWDRLDDGVRERAGAWLAQALHRAPNDNNWWLFPLTVGGFLAEAGIETTAARAAVERGLAKIDQWYRGDGWYTDGRPHAFDHYNGWAMHFYPMLHAHLAGDTALLARYGDRLAAHLDGYALTFGADGAPMHQGRSLIYRFAAAAPLWTGALTGRTPLSPGTTRRLASGALRYFLDRGATDPEGLLTLGWHGPYPPLVQTYSGPASPYWSASGFLGLLLPPEHPVWTDREEPAPAERTDALRELAGPGWLVQATAADGVVRLHNHGSDDQPADEVAPDNPLYARLAHSTATGPARELPDNHFGLEDGGEYSERGRITPLGTGPGWAASTHRPRLRGQEVPGVRVTSLTLAHGADELRIHLLSGATPGTRIVHGGWALAGRRVEGTVLGTAVSAWTVEGAGMESPGAEGGLRTEARGLRGFTSADLEHSARGNAFGPAVSVPVLRGSAEAQSALFACALRLMGPSRALGTGGPEVGAEERATHPVAATDPGVSRVVEALAPFPDVEFEPSAPEARQGQDSSVTQGWTVSVRWPDGSRHRARLSSGAVDVEAVPAD